MKSSGGKHAEAIFELALECQRDGDDRAAIDHYRQAIAQSEDRIPACHNNLGVILAQAGMVEEATREFETAVKNSRGKFIEADQNLTRCRKMTGAPSPVMIASLKMVGGASGVEMRAE